jgi:hypothetical protein
MNLEQFIALDEGHTISSQDAQSLNDCLARTSAESIPTDQRGRVADYLATALNMESVSQETVARLESLLGNLQDQP